MNILVIAMIIVLFCTVVTCGHRGMVKSLISFISLIFLSIVTVLLGNGICSYFTGDYLKLAIVIFLLSILGIVHHLLGVVFLPAKLVSKLPVIKSGDKLLGILVGVLEAILILWVVYAMIILFDMGDLSTAILGYTAENPVLTWFYEHNYLMDAVQALGAQVPDVKLPDINLDFRNSFNVK